MAGKADYVENALLNGVFRATGPFGTLFATTYLALFTVTPGEDGTGGTECAYGSYARVPVTSSTTNWKDPSTATQGQVENLFNISFPPNGGPSAETVVAVGVYDAVSAGNLLYFATISNVTINRQDQPQFAANSIVIAEG